MARDLRFRIWDRERQQMAYPDNYVLDFSWFGVTTEHYLDDSGTASYPINGNDYSVMQFTGMKDKNGKEIWEGDIVKAAHMHHGNPGISFTAIIFYNEHIGSFRIGYDSLGGGSQDEVYFRYQIEVIGNVFETPELAEWAEKFIEKRE